MKTLRVAIIQTSAGPDIEENLCRLDELLADVAGVDIIALPEVFAARGDTNTYRESAQQVNGPIVERMAELAARRNSWVLAGSIIEKEEASIYNTSVLLDRSGNVVTTYRKIHLFEAQLEDGTVIKESDAYEAGDNPVSVSIEGWHAGLAMCYDVRFPELFRHYAAERAGIVFVPSNFTQRTGKDHWEMLMRARAIENQCFIIAPNQCGENPATGVPSYGHSIAVGPWGEVLCEAGAAEEILIAEVDPGEISRTRDRVPALDHRRL